ncbi:MAG: hypothetical protein IJS52_04690 [Bacilli bacterium]|nr:hypothetical protein [Bacilli bacterium]
MAVINGLDPYRYLKYPLENVGKKPIEAILPYSKDLEIRSDPPSISFGLLKRRIPVLCCK